MHRTHDGVRELILVEWKYTERYGPRTVVTAKDAVRYERYGHLLAAPDGPIVAGLFPFEELLQEPLYQLVRQQLLAHELEKAGAHGADRVRVVHVMPAGNSAYHASLHGTVAPLLGATVKDVWQRLLRRAGPVRVSGQRRVPRPARSRRSTTSSATARRSSRRDVSVT